MNSTSASTPLGSADDDVSHFVSEISFILSQKRFFSSASPVHLVVLHRNTIRSKSPCSLPRMGSAVGFMDQIHGFFYGDDITTSQSNMFKLLCRVV